MIDALEIGYAIKEQRLLLGLTQAQVAKRAGVSPRCLWSLELGQNAGVQLDKLTAVLRVLGLDLTLSVGGAPQDDVQSASTFSENTNPDGEKSVAIDALAILTGRAQ